MATLEQTEIPPELDPPDIDPPDSNVEEAPYGYKADGTPRARPGRKPGAGSSGSSTSKPNKSLQSLREPLAQRLVEYIGGPIMLVSPIGAAVWEDRVERTTDAILLLAARSPRWRKWVERIVAGSAGGDLGITLAGVVTGMLVDTGRIEPTGKVAHYFNIDEIYAELYGPYQEGQSNPDNARGLLAEVS